MVQPFRLVQKLSEGATADVFLARLTGQGANVLVEVLRNEVGKDVAVVDRFLEEARVHQSLDHPHVARRVGAGRTGDGLPYFVSQPFTGESLRAYLEHHRSLSSHQVIRLMLPLCDAVSYLHQRGLVHGNIKPATVFLAGGIEANNPLLFDSGLSLFRSGKPPTGEHRRVMVEPEYLSPERVQGHRATLLSDVYGLGILLYELLTGDPPFRAKFARDTKALHLRAPVPELPVELDPLAAVIRKCLAKDLVDRYPDAGSLKAALQEVERESAHLHRGAELAPGPLDVPREGEVLGSYELVRVLGEGAMGKVFLGRHTKLDRHMAIKLLKPQHVLNRSFVERFFQEARAANQINHEHIVEVFDFVEDKTPAGSPRVYCVMEHLQGESLERLLRHEPLSIARAVHILRQLCEALEAAHRVGVIHRDIKPDNIFLTERAGKSDYVKVLDFGVAKVRRKDDNEVEGEIVGTPAYMAPEQATGDPPDARTDIYAVGCVLYRILSGRVPFRATGFGHHLALLASAPPPPLPPRTCRGELIPPPLQRIALRCLAKQPGDRPESMVALSESLKPFESYAPVGDGDPTLVPYQTDSVQSAVEREYESTSPPEASPSDVIELHSLKPRPSSPRPPTPPPPSVTPEASPSDVMELTGPTPPRETPHAKKGDHARLAWPHPSAISGGEREVSLELSDEPISLARPPSPLPTKRETPLTPRAPAEPAARHRTSRVTRERRQRQLMLGLTVAALAVALLALATTLRMRSAPVQAPPTFDAPATSAPVPIPVDSKRPKGKRR